MLCDLSKCFLIPALAFGLVACGGGSSGSGDTSSATDTGSASSVTKSTSPSTTAPTPPPGSSSASSGSAVNTRWTIPNTREDGSPLQLSEIQGYEIYYYKSGTPQSQGTVIAINNPSQTSYKTGVLSPGTYYFAISSIDSNGVYSQLSNFVAVTIL